MKKNNFLLIFTFVLIATSCSPKNELHQRSLAQKWQDKHLKEDTPLIRSLASLVNVAAEKPNNMCLVNFFNVETLKKEVQEKEAQFIGQTVEGSWRHLDYSQLPLPQANFLSKYGKKIGDLRNPEAIDYSSCSNLICVFNKVYGKNEDYIAGYVHYLWYLKFRNYLSLDNLVEGQSSPVAGFYRNQEHPLANYLYSETELYGFWRLSQIINEPFTTISDFQEIQRIPRGFLIEGHIDVKRDCPDTDMSKACVDARKSAPACGDATANKFIRLADGCLRIDETNKDEGFFYIGIFHEMAHLLDYDQAKKSRTSNSPMQTSYSSEDQSYIDLIGFKKTFITNPDGTQTFSWTLDPSIKTVRGYTRVNPLENFADNIAYYRFDGDTSKKNTDPHVYEWIKTNYFNNEVFSKSNQRAQLLDKYLNKNNDDILFSTFDCNKYKGTIKSYYFYTSHFPNQNIDYQTVGCLSEKAEKIKDKINAEIAMYELEGCNFISESTTSTNGWHQQIRTELARRMGIYTQSLTQSPRLNNYANDFKNTLKSRVIANTAFLECYGGNFQTNVSQCYSEKIITKIETHFANIQAPKEFIDELSRIYLQSYSYGDTLDKLLIAYQSIIDSHQVKLETEANSLWSMCKNTDQNDSEARNGTLFIPKRYIVSSLSNCLNLNVQETISRAINEINFDGSYIRYPAEEIIFKELITPRILNAIDSLHKEAAEEEKKSLPDVFFKYAEVIKEDLLSDFSWLPSLDDQKMIITQCRIEGLKKIDYLPLFHIKRDVFTNALEAGPCVQLMKDERFKAHIQSIRQDIQDKVYSKIGSLLKTYGTQRALECIDKIPGSGTFARKVAKMPRKACLSLGWKEVKEKVVADLIKAPEILRYKISQGFVKREVDSREDKVKKEIEEENF